MKFERWDELLDAKTIPWRDIFADKVQRSYFEARGHFGKGELDKAEKSIAAHTALKKDLEKNKNGPVADAYETQALELRGRLGAGAGRKPGRAAGDVRCGATGVRVAAGVRGPAVLRGIAI